jgi:hypothetical protein
MLLKEAFDDGVGRRRVVDRELNLDMAHADSSGALVPSLLCLLKLN